MWSFEKLQIAYILKLSIHFFLCFLQLVNSNFGSVKSTARAQLVQWYHLVLELSLALICSPWIPHRQGTNKNRCSVTFFCLSLMLHNGDPNNIHMIFVILCSRRPWHLCTPTVIFISPHSRKQESLCLNLGLLFDFWVMPTLMPCTICFPNGLLRDSTELLLLFFFKLKSHPPFWAPIPTQNPLVGRNIFMYIVFDVFVSSREMI